MESNASAFADSSEPAYNWSSTPSSYPDFVTKLDAYNQRITYHYGEVRDPLYIVIPITIIYAIIFVMGTIGNISTCIVIARNKSMHTATNYYLFSLAVSDLLLLLSGLPFEIYMVWSKYPFVFGEIFCVIRGMAAETSSNASVLTITAFTAERYVAICHPFLSQTMSKLSRAIKLILFVWFVAFLCAIPQAMQFGLVPIVPDAKPGDVLCLVKDQSRDSNATTFFGLSSLIFFVVPMSVIILLYALIGLKLKKSTMIKRNCRQIRKRSESTKVKAGSSKIDRHCRHSRSTRRVLKMLVAVVVAFFICWAPFHLQRIVFILIDPNQIRVDRNKTLENFLLFITYISGVLYYFSTTVNPILYNIMSNKFREAFVETLARSCRLSRLMSPRMRRSYSSLSRSQQRHPGNYPSKATGASGTGIAQESTDCSGNSYRDEFPPDRILDYSTSESPPLPLLYTSSSGSRQSSKKGIITIEFGSNRTENGSNLSVQSESKYKNKPMGFHFVNLSKNHQKNLDRYDDNGEPVSPEFEVYTKVNRNPTSVHHQYNGYSNNTQSTNTVTKKKWWRLFDWLPGIKSLRNSRQALAQPVPSSNIILDFDNRLTKQQQEDYLLQMQTFKIKEESCRPT